jgi:oligopeptide transport system substrate-binding protein
VQADWRAIGVEATLVQNETQILFSALGQRDFQASFVSWVGDYNDPLTFLDLFHSQTGGQNYGDYRNPAYDALLLAASREPNATRRGAILRRAEQAVLNDEAVAPIYFGVSRNLVNPRITGWVGNISDRHRARWLCVNGAEPHR